MFKKRNKTYERKMYHLASLSLLYNTYTTILRIILLYGTLQLGHFNVYTKTKLVRDY